MHEFRRGDVQAVSLENDLLRTTFLAGEGAKVVEFLYKPRGIDLASWSTPGLTGPQGIEGMPADTSVAFVDQITDGWWDVFPSGGAPSSYRGTPLSVLRVMDGVPTAHPRPNTPCGLPES